MSHIAWGGLFFAASGCAAQAADPSVVVSSDPELARVSAAIIPGLAERAGLTLRRPIRVERRSRPELEGYLRAKLDEDLPVDVAEYTTDVYARLGLVERDLDLRSVLLELYMEQVAGFYDPDSTALFVIDDQPAAALEPLLAHELVHALQDQATELDLITDPAVGNDRAQAASAAIEGHATLVMLEFSLERQQGSPVDVTLIPGFAEQFRPALATLQGQSPALAKAPAIIRESLLFPYFDGASFVEALWKDGDGRPAPFGSSLPTSTEQILHPDRFLGEERDTPIEVVIEPPRGWSSLCEDSLGEFEIRILLAEHLGDAPSAIGWDGDRFALLAEPTGERSLSWISVWDSHEDRERFSALIARVADRLDGASVRSLEVQGRPALELSVGPAPPAGATLQPDGER